MSLEKLLEKNESVLVKRWFDIVISTYPEDTQRFIQSQKDPFANPVGQTTLSSLKSLFGLLKHEIDAEAAAGFLDPVIRIRAVQAFTPSRAVAFVPDLKVLVRSMFRKELSKQEMNSHWHAFERRVDHLTLIAFDIYMACREKIFELKANNERTRVLNTFSRAGLLKEDEDA